MSFALSKSVTNKNIFLTNFSNVTEKRWDPNYQLLFENFIGKISTSPFPVERLKDSINYLQYGTSERASEEPVGTAVLRMANMQKEVWDLDKLKYLDVTQKEKEHYLLKKGDLLFNRTNSKELVGKCTEFNLDGEYIFASYLIRVRLNTEKLLPQYVTTFLSSNLGRMQIDAVSRQIAGMTNVNAEEIKDLLIPVPSLSQQHLIVKKMKEAFDLKHQKENEAKELLNSISGYLLKELGIERPKKDDKCVSGRMFTRQFSEVSGGRYDPGSRQKPLELYSDKYPNELLSKNVLLNPSTAFNKVNEDAEVSFIPMDAISDVNGIVYKKYTRPISESKGYTSFQEHDLLWAKITPCMENGKSAVVYDLVEGVGFGSTEFHVFRVKNNEVTEIRYIHALLRLKLLRQNASCNFNGSAGHQRVDIAYFRKLVIPFPAIEIQQKIVNEMESRRERAFQMKQKANAILTTAKAEVEQMILQGNL